MRNFFFQKKLQRLERYGNNDYSLIIEFGADAYSTEELNSILIEVYSQQQLASRWQRKLFILGFGISILMAASIFARITNAEILSYIFLFLVPAMLFIGLVGYFILHYRYPNLADGHLINSIVQQELEWRKKDKYWSNN